MNEKIISIPTPDGFMIRGTFNQQKTSDHLLMFIHGLFGSQYDHIFHNAAHFFVEKNLDTFRFDLYGSSVKTRKLSNTTISQSSEDVETILDFLKDHYSYKKISLVAHSLGAILVLLAGIKDLYRMVFWEPSQEPINIFSNTTKTKNENRVIFSDRMDILLHKKVIEDTRRIPPISTLIKRIPTPIKIIVAENAGEKIGERYYLNANEPKSLYCVRGAGHNFDEWGSEDVLFHETLSWLSY